MFEFISDAYNNTVGSIRDGFNDPVGTARGLLNNPLVNPHSITGKLIENGTGVSYEQQLMIGAAGGTIVAATPTLMTSLPSTLPGGLTVSEAAAAYAGQRANDLLSHESDSAPPEIAATSKSADNTPMVLGVGLLVIILAFKFGG